MLWNVIFKMYSFMLKFSTMSMKSYISCQLIMSFISETSNLNGNVLCAGQVMF